MSTQDNNVDATRLVRMFRAAAGQIRANADALSKYDSVGGDGDHGTTMVRAMGNLEKAIEETVSGFKFQVSSCPGVASKLKRETSDQKRSVSSSAPNAHNVKPETGNVKPDLGTLLNNIGWAVMGTDGGATGPLFGSFFSGMAPAAAGRNTLDAKTLAAALEGGLANIQKYSKAKPGDKTMLDALIPAVQRMRASADAGADSLASLRQAAEVAAQGAEATKQMVARVGRAKNIGEKSLGSPDPGAVSVSLIFKGFVEGAEETFQV